MEKITKQNKVRIYVLLTCIIIITIIIIMNWHYIINFELDKIMQIIEGNGVFSIIIYIFIFMIKPLFIIIPANVLAIAAGTIFGPVLGFILTMIGFFISGTVAFFLARVLGRSFVESIVGNKFIKLDNNIEKRGFKILFLLRLPPMIPYDPLSYACGLTKVSYKKFILASLIGVGPETICYSILGKSLENKMLMKFIFPIIIVAIIIIIIKKVRLYKI